MVEKIGSDAWLHCQWNTTDNNLWLPTLVLCNTPHKVGQCETYTVRAVCFHVHFTFYTKQVVQNMKWTQKCTLVTVTSWSCIFSCSFHIIHFTGSTKCEMKSVKMKAGLYLQVRAVCFFVGFAFYSTWAVKWTHKCMPTHQWVGVSDVLQHSIFGFVPYRHLHF